MPRHGCGNSHDGAGILTLGPLNRSDLAPAEGGGLTNGGMIEEFCHFVEALAQEMPLVLCLDDFQLADVATINALEALALRDMPAKLLVLGTASLASWRTQRLMRSAFSGCWRGFARGHQPSGCCSGR